MRETRRACTGLALATATSSLPDLLPVRPDEVRPGTAGLHPRALHVTGRLVAVVVVERAPVVARVLGAVGARRAAGHRRLHGGGAGLGRGGFRGGGGTRP